MTLQVHGRYATTRNMVRLGVRAIPIAALVIAFFEGGTAGLVLGLAGGLGLIGVLGREIRQSSSVFQRVRRRMQDARPWPPPIATDETDGWNPYADDCFTGLWNGARAHIVASTAGASIVMKLDRWPVGLAAERCGEAGGAITGDEAFDRVVRVLGDDVLWRCTLTPEPRRHLAAICTRARATVRDQTLEVAVHDAEIEALDEMLDRAAALAAALPAPPAEPMARVFELAIAEPVSGVRALHYRWLVEQGWNTLQVHRAAAEDDDPAISAWAASQLPPTDGVFR